jgi:hypothetical protein
MRTLILPGLATVLLAAGCRSADNKPETAPLATDPAASPGEEDSAAQYEPPESCAALNLAPGTDLSGETVGRCWTDALYAFGSFHEYILSGGEAGEVDVRLSPELAVAGTTPDGEEPFIYVGNVLYEQDNVRWINVDRKSDDADEAILGATADAIKAIADPNVIAQAIGRCRKWRVDFQRDVVQLQNGREYPDAARLTCVSVPFDVLGVPVSESIIWADDDWTPLKTQSTDTGAVSSGTTSQVFYNLGKAVSIEAPPG